MTDESAAETKLVPTLILASASPRRQELIALLRLPFAVVPSRYEEPAPPSLPIDLPAFVTTLAIHKGKEVAERRQADLAQGTLIVAADTLVTVADSDFGIPLGKPRDEADAYQMLQQLSGRTHRVYTGIVVIAALAAAAYSDSAAHYHNDLPANSSLSEVSLPPGLVMKTSAVCTCVHFRELSDSMIANYIATGEPHDKAGAYGAQGFAAPFIEGFEGDFFNVVGLPLCRLGQLLDLFGISWGSSRNEMPLRAS